MQSTVTSTFDRNTGSLEAIVHDGAISEMIDGLARRVCIQSGRRELIEDAKQEAWAVCLELAPQYDPTKGVSLARYLRWHVYYAVLHYCRENSGAFSIPERMWRRRNEPGRDDLNAAIYTDSLNETETRDGDEGFDQTDRISDGERIGAVYRDGATNESDIWREMEYHHLNALMERLLPTERRILDRFGEGYSCAEIARELGVSRQRVHQVLHRAFAKIRGWWESPSAA